MIACSLALLKTLVGFIIGHMQKQSNLVVVVVSNMTLPGRVVREGKERRRQWAQKLTPRPSKASKETQDDDVSGSEPQQKSNTAAGFLPDDIVQLLAAREKYV